MTILLNFNRHRTAYHHPTGGKPLKKQSLPTIPIESVPAISQLVQEVKKSDTPILFTKDGKADTVAMSVPVYKSLFGQFEVCEKVLEGIRNAQEGHTSDAMEFICSLDDKLNTQKAPNDK